MKLSGVRIETRHGTPRVLELADVTSTSATWPILKVQWRASDLQTGWATNEWQCLGGNGGVGNISFTDAAMQGSDLDLYHLA